MFAQGKGRKSPIAGAREATILMGVVSAGHADLWRLQAGWLGRFKSLEKSRPMVGVAGFRGLTEATAALTQIRDGAAEPCFLGATGADPNKGIDACLNTT